MSREEAVSAADGNAAAIFEAALAFVTDANAFVAKNALDTLAHGLSRISNTDMLCEQFERAMSVTDGKLLNEPLVQSRLRRQFLWSRGENADEKCLTSLVKSIEAIKDEETRKTAEAHFKDMTGSGFAGMAGAETQLEWQHGLTDMGTQLFGTKDNGRQFAGMVDIQTRIHGDSYFEDKEPDVEDASTKFHNPVWALLFVKAKENLREDSKILHGEGEMADRWYEERRSEVEAWYLKQDKETYERLRRREEQEAKRKKEEK